MPNKTVNILMEAVSKLHDSVIEMHTDMRWLKRGMIGIYSVFGVAIITAIVGALLH